MSQKEQKIAEVENQVNELLDEFKKIIMEKAARVYSSGSAPEEFLELGVENALLAKAVFDSACKDRPCHALAYKKEFENIHISC